MRGQAFDAPALLVKLLTLLIDLACQFHIREERPAIRVVKTKLDAIQLESHP